MGYTLGTFILSFVAVKNDTLKNSSWPQWNLDTHYSADKQDIFDLLNNQDILDENFFILCKKELTYILNIFRAWIYWFSIVSLPHLSSLSHKEILLAIWFIPETLEKIKKYVFFLKYNLKTSGKLPLPYKILLDKLHSFGWAAGSLYFWIEKNIEEVEDMIKDIWDHGQNLVSIINKLSYSDELEYSSFHPANIVHHLIGDKHFNLQEKNISVINNIQNDNFVIHSSPYVFESVIENLLANAIKFTPSWWTISLWIVSTDETATTFFVEDTGVGISWTTDVFSAGISTPDADTKRSSTWVWLSLCRDFLLGIWWSISYTSWKNGQWTRFLVTIPNKREH